MIHILALVLTIAGFSCLCAAMIRHQKDFTGHTLAPAIARRVRVVGFALLTAALALDMAGLGADYGAIAWFAHLSVGAALVLTWLNRRVAMRKRGIPG